VRITNRFNFICNWKRSWSLVAHAHPYHAHAHHAHLAHVHHVSAHAHCSDFGNIFLELLIDCAISSLSFFELIFVKLQHKQVVEVRLIQNHPAKGTQGNVCTHQLEVIVMCKSPTSSALFAH